MGWKNVKEHYRIGHTVHVSDGKICIGSAYISEIIVIDPVAREFNKRDRPGWVEKSDLSRYQDEMDADLDTLWRLIAEPDHFESSIKVYSWSGGDIIEQLCEAPGWPNVTHDGELMYENSHSTDRDQVVEWAKKDAESGVRWADQAIVEAERKIEELRTERAKHQAHLAKLIAGDAA